MSINHLINQDAVPKYDIYTNDITLEEDGKIENAKVSVTNGDIVDFSSLASYGAPSERLTSNGDGTCSWVAGAGTSGIEYSGIVPVTLGKLAKYSATDGSLVNETSFVDTDILLKDGSVAMTGNLDLNSNDIINVSNITSGVINCLTINSTDAKTNRVFLTGTLDMTTNNINNVNILDVDNIQSSNPSINVNTPIDMNVNNIERVGDLETSTISALTSSINMVNNVSLQNNDITNCNLLGVDNIQSINLIDDIVIGSNVDMFQKEIKNCLNITTTDLNTDTISANAPATEIKLGTNTDLNLDGNNIIGLDTINGIQPSGGVYSNPTSNSYTGATAETDILTGTEYGSKTVPANDGFSAGSLYSLKIGGEFDATNNDVFTIRVLSNYNTLDEAEFVNIPITITDTNLTNQYFELEIDFAIRTTGGAGVASILTNGSFDYYNTNNLKKGTGINNLNNTTFRTDIDNTLSVTYSTIEASVNFTCDIATITKFY